VTFSIVAHDPASGAFGVAVATARPNVGSLVPFANPHGAVATQARVNPDLGRKGVELLALGVRIESALTALLEADPEPALRQLHGVDRAGAHASTGAACVPWAGHQIGKRFSVAGNMLAGPEVVERMAKSILAPSEADLSLRLLRALEAGQAAGGDKRGRQSAALLVASAEPQLFHNLRVDEHANPVAELRRIYGLVVAHAEEIREQYGEATLRGFSRVKR